MAHYDNTATIVADVRAGQDEHGQWIAGAMRPGVTEEQIRAMRAQAVSGDWRSLGGSLDLVAALSVPVPGFPIAVVADGQQVAMVASGASVMHALKHPAEPESQGDTLVRALSPLLRLAARQARERVSALRPAEPDSALAASAARERLAALG
jgi:hypothetical protein